ncbi:MAG: Replicative DNA helicase [Parcubacteria group bacterium Gr01-1014_18]|nr:MAG: Replicative DNA helicase [Parcubacteria group bacterium Greene0416_36]TSC81113.1 MAG: Replicative DNA helicase [Parcubacteria group bacterium Gr01-1014_18]TSC98471.1 MAG: Replicative DNA helicase [Parcubacteria group bacterium Greene1014_20]TSD07364.1 MAG: Replicative DNA helicase [Parcubacteria group bacterium Greene0714_2]
MNNQPAFIPPQNLEAEQSLLGCILIDRDAFLKIGDQIVSEDFYQQSHGDIFEAMSELFARREPVDILTLSNLMEEKKQLEKVGGRSYLASLANVVPTASHIKHYASIIEKKSILRKLIRAAGEIGEITHDQEEDTEKMLDLAEQKLFSVSQKKIKKAFIPIKDILIEAFDRIDEIHREKGKLRGVPSGFKSLDNLLGGFQNSDLIILAARPSFGKTSLALDFARNIATLHKIPVGLFSLEMSKEQLVDRLLCAQAGVDLWKMRTGKLSDRPEDDDFPKIGNAMGVLSEAPIFIDDSSSTNIMEIRTKARRLQMEQGLGVIIIDYLQLIEGRRAESRVQEVAEISRSLKGLAKELNIPVITLSQLSRAVESREKGIPKLSDLRESGSIEQDADVVMFIHREDKFKSATEKNNIAEIHVAKHRNGPVGKADLFFRENRASFENIDKTRQDVVG